MASDIGNWKFISLQFFRKNIGGRFEYRERNINISNSVDPFSPETPMRNLDVAKVLVVCSFVSGCATTGTDGIVQIGPDMYMVGGLGKFTDFSSSGVKGRLYQEANKYCSEKNRVMLPVNSTGQDSGYGTYASAEIQFRCLTPDALRLPK